MTEKDRKVIPVSDEELIDLVKLEFKSILKSYKKALKEHDIEEQIFIMHLLDLFRFRNKR